MKRLTTILLAAVLLSAAFVLPASAESWGGRYFAQTDTCDATGPNAAYLGFTGVRRQIGSIPHVITGNVTSDLAGSVLTLLTENGDSTTTDEAYSSGGKLLPVTATTAFQATTAGAGSWVAIYDVSDKEWEINRVSSITAGASLNLVRNTDNSYASGAKVYELTTVGTVVVGNTTKDWPTIHLVGDPGETLGIAVNGTSSCAINSVFGDYLPE